jgi:hypothetical protein
LPQLKTVNEHFRELKRDYVNLFHLPTRIRLIRRFKIKDCTDYGKNQVKTEEGKYISACECDPATVDAEFLLWKSRYKAANRIGYELAMRWTKGRHQFIVTIHTDNTDKAHMVHGPLLMS